MSCMRMTGDIGSLERRRRLLGGGMAVAGAALLQVSGQRRRGRCR